MRDIDTALNPRVMIARIDCYLSRGGLFNPEMANHDQVRSLLEECRGVVELLGQEIERLREIANRNGFAALIAAQDAGYTMVENKDQPVSGASGSVPSEAP